VDPDPDPGGPKTCGSGGSGSGCFRVRVGAWCTGLPAGLPIKENPGDTSLQSTASDGHRHTPRGHNLNYTIWILYAESVEFFNVTLWARPFQKGRALSHPPSQSEHALPERGAPSPKGARPIQKGRALSKRGAPSSKGVRPLKRGSFPFCQTVSQELRMDEEIAKIRTSL
jgi:hypothetical protein